MRDFTAVGPTWVAAPSIRQVLLEPHCLSTNKDVMIIYIRYIIFSKINYPCYGYIYNLYYFDKSIGVSMVKFFLMLFVLIIYSIASSIAHLIFSENNEVRSNSYQLWKLIGNNSRLIFEIMGSV